MCPLHPSYILLGSIPISSLSTLHVLFRQGKDEILVDSEMLLKLRKAPFSIHPVDVDFLERCELPLDLIGL